MESSNTFEAIVKESARLAEGIFLAARNFAGDNPQLDDVTDVIVKVA